MANVLWCVHIIACIFVRMGLGIVGRERDFGGEEVL